MGLSATLSNAAARPHHCESQAGRAHLSGGGLSLRRRQRRKRLSHLRVVRPLPTATNQIWAMDFIHDSLSSGRRYRALVVIDHWSRESLAIEVDVSLTGEWGGTQILEPSLRAWYCPL